MINVQEEKQQVKLNYEHQLDLLRQDNEEKLKEQQQQHISILQVSFMCPILQVRSLY